MSLKERLQAVSLRARELGAILPLQMQTQTVEGDGLRYRVAWVSSLIRKDMATLLQKSGPGGSNPFLPYEDVLFVDDLSTTHVALLNKFPMEDGHVMAVTRAFVSQLAPWDAPDFEALATLLLEVGGYAMYNGGKVGGASQEHRHLHMLPQGQLPFDPLFPKDAAPGQIAPVHFFPFVHAFMCLDQRLTDVQALAGHLQQLFDAACQHCAMVARDGEMPPYNILATPRWLLVVPRTQECWSDGPDSISISALHYGGLVAVREPRLMETVQRTGLMQMLAAVSHPLAPVAP